MAKVPRKTPEQFADDIKKVMPWFHWEVTAEKFIANIKTKHYWKRNFFANFFHWNKTPEGVDYWKSVDAVMNTFYWITDDEVETAAMKWAVKKAKKQADKERNLLQFSEFGGKDLPNFDNLPSKFVDEPKCSPCTSTCEDHGCTTTDVKEINSTLDEIMNSPAGKKSTAMLAKRTWESMESIEASIRRWAIQSPDAMERLTSIFNMSKTLWAIKK